MKRESASSSSPGSNDKIKRFKSEDAGAVLAPSSSISTGGGKVPPSEVSVDMSMPEQAGAREHAEVAFRPPCRFEALCVKGF